jgi:transcriptional regulator with XRE-family HTH domain
MTTLASSLGERIRKLRLGRNLTLRQVEAVARVSATHLSEIERGRTSPTVGALVRIAAALGEDAARLVDDDAPVRVHVTRRAARRVFRDGDAAWSRLSGPVVPGDLAVFEAGVAAGATADASWFSGAREVFVFVLRGAGELALGADRVSLREGDACHFLAGEWRELRNHGPGDLQLLCAAVPGLCP